MDIKKPTPFYITPNLYKCLLALLSLYVSVWWKLRALAPAGRSHEEWYFGDLICGDLAIARGEGYVPHTWVSVGVVFQNKGNKSKERGGDQVNIRVTKPPVYHISLQ